MVLTYRYKDVLRSNGTHAKSPSIPIVFENKYEFIALLDSGADVSALSRNVAELLGLNLSGLKEETFGIGGSAPAVGARLE